MQIFAISKIPRHVMKMVYQANIPEEFVFHRWVRTSFEQGKSALGAEFMRVKTVEYSTIPVAYLSDQGWNLAKQESSEDTLNALNIKNKLTKKIDPLLSPEEKAWLNDLPVAHHILIQHLLKELNSNTGRIVGLIYGGCDPYGTPAYTFNISIRGTATLSRPYMLSHGELTRLLNLIERSGGALKYFVKPAFNSAKTDYCKKCSEHVSNPSSKPLILSV